MSLEHVILPNGDHRWFLDGKLLSLKHVKVTVDDVQGEFWYKDGKLNRDEDEPSEIFVRADELKITSRWHKNGELHRDGDNPAEVIEEDDSNDGLLTTRSWYQNGKLNREDDKPSEIVITKDGDDAFISQYWHKNGELHRDGDNPAIIKIKGLVVDDGDTGDLEFIENKWYKSGKIYTENEDNIKDQKCVARWWYKDGEQHRDGDKPSCIGETYAFWYKDGKKIKSVDLYENFIVESPNVISGKFIDDTVLPLSESDVKICRTLKYKGKDGKLYNFKVKGGVTGTDFVSRLQEFAFSGDGSDLILIIGNRYNGCSVSELLSGLKRFRFTGNMTDILSCISQASDKHIWQKDSKFVFSFEKQWDLGNCSVKTNGHTCPITGIIIEDTYGTDKIVKRKKDGCLTDKDIRICEEFGLKISLGY